MNQNFVKPQLRKALALKAHGLYHQAADVYSIVLQLEPGCAEARAGLVVCKVRFAYCFNIELPQHITHNEFLLNSWMQRPRRKGH